MKKKIDKEKKNENKFQTYLSLSAVMTRVSELRLLLMAPPSLSRAPVALVSRARSDPAKSTKFKVADHELAVAELNENDCRHTHT
jgi:hypothetical protein